MCIIKLSEFRLTKVFQLTEGNTENIIILAVETSCDETSAAVVENGRKIRSNIISSQIDIHKKFGGVVPEIASRKHVELIIPVIGQALEEASVSLDRVDAVAVTYGPGLAGALLVGLSAAKALAFAAGKPLVGVHHIEGHIAATTSNTKTLSLRSYASWHRAATAISCTWRITTGLK